MILKLDTQLLRTWFAIEKIKKVKVLLKVY